MTAATCVYLIRNVISKKSYVGSSNDAKKRFSFHRQQLRHGRHHSFKLQRSWDKHGEAAFEFVVVELVDDANFLRAREQMWIWRLDSAARGYNVRSDAETPTGISPSVENRRALREAMIRYWTPEKRAAQSLVGKRSAAKLIRGPEMRRKMSEGSRRSWASGVRKPNGRWGTPGLREHLDRIRALRKPWTEERRRQQGDRTRASIAAKMAARSPAEIAEQKKRRKRRATELMRGYRAIKREARKALEATGTPKRRRKLTAEHAAKIGNWMRGRPKSDAQRAKISATITKWWAQRIAAAA